MAETGLQVELTNCDREPIHLLGAVQPFGFLIALDSTQWTVTRASRNVAEWLAAGPAGLIGRSIDDVFTPESIHLIRGQLQTALFTSTVARAFSVALLTDGPRFDLAVHVNEDTIVIECEPCNDEQGVNSSALVRAMIARLQRYLKEMEAATAARERVEGELSAARDIQVGMLPRTFPPFPQRRDVDVFALLESAKHVGGDLYDYALIDGDRLFFVVGDVSGKGVPAAFFMADAVREFELPLARKPEAFGALDGNVPHRAELNPMREPPVIGLRNVTEAVFREITHLGGFEQQARSRFENVLADDLGRRFSPAGEFDAAIVSQVGVEGR